LGHYEQGAQQKGPICEPISIPENGYLSDAYLGPKKPEVVLMIIT